MSKSEAPENSWIVGVDGHQRCNWCSNMFPKHELDCPILEIQDLEKELVELAEWFETKTGHERPGWLR